MTAMLIFSAFIILLLYLFISKPSREEMEKAKVDRPKRVSSADLVSTVINSNIPAIHDKLILQMLNHGCVLIEETQSRLVFEKQSGEASSFVSSVIAGEYMARVRIQHAFFLVASPEGVVVTGTSDSLSQNAYGSPVKTRLSGPFLQRQLDDLKRECAVGVG